jgi:hypothetical protein
MNLHRYQFLYLPIHRLTERISGPARWLLWAGQLVIVITLLSLALMRMNLI